MAAFINHQLQSFVLDQTVFYPNPTTTTIANAATSFPQIYQPNDQVSVANKLQSPDSSMSMVVDGEKFVSGNELLAKKRKNKHTSSLNQAQSKDTGSRLKKPKKSNDYQEEKKKKNNNGSREEEGKTGYIHVRARRGQATDSHSLAERVRREKISARMKLLQSIVPGCNKVTGKALMLDEIINYIQSLQNQVEFLSMKLASANPMLYDFGVDLDTFMIKPDENMSSMELPIMLSVSDPKDGAADFTPAAYNYHHLPQLIDGSVASNSSLFQQSQMENILSQGQYLWDVDEQRLKLDNRFALSYHLTSFN